MTYKYTRRSDAFVITRISDDKKVFVHRKESDGKAPAEYDLLWSEIEAGDHLDEDDRREYLGNVLHEWFEEKQ